MSTDGAKSIRERLNLLLLYHLPKKLRTYYRLPLFKALIRVYFKVFTPLLRLFSPLFGCQVMIGLTYRCQCRCRHCCINMYPKDKAGELSRAEVFALIDEVAALGASGITLFGGEPMLSPDYLDYARRARERGLYVSINTNGYKLDEAAARDMREAGITKVFISVDGSDEAQHDEWHGLPGAYRRAIDGLKNAAAHGMHAVLSVCATGEKVRNGEIARTLELSGSIGAATRLTYPMRAGNWLDGDNSGLTAEDRAALERFPNEDMTLCSAGLRAIFYVSPYGEVQPCPSVPVAYGNIREGGLLRTVREMWRSGLIPVLETELKCPTNSPVFRDMCLRIGPSEGYPRLLAEKPCG